MVVAIGVDIVQISRIGAILERHGPRFLRRVLHPSEITAYNALLPGNRTRYVAGAWAAKEALFKTLDAHDQADFAFTRWARFSDGRRPAIGLAAEIPPLGSPPVPPISDEFLLSISHDNDMLVATVLRQRRNR